MLTGAYHPVQIQSNPKPIQAETIQSNPRACAARLSNLEQNSRWRSFRQGAREHCEGGNLISMGWLQQADYGGTAHYGESLLCTSDSFQIEWNGFNFYVQSTLGDHLVFLARSLKPSISPRRYGVAFYGPFATT